MSSSHDSHPSPARRPRDVDPLLVLLDEVLRPDAAESGLERRILDATAAEFRAAARADARLARRLDAELVPSHVIPADLEPRVHAASVGGLRAADVPVHLAPAASDRARGVLGRVGQARTLAGRLAMAASFGILALAGWWTTQPDVAPGPLASSPDRLPAARLVSLEDLSWSSLEDSAAVEAELALLEDWDVGSYADVAGEIEAIIPDFLLVDARP